VPDPDQFGSRTRDHLANERTYLAWIRTAANVMVLGLAVAKLAAHDSAYSLAAGTLLVATGTAGIAVGTLRYRRAARDIDAGRFGSVAITSVALTCSSILVVAFVVALLLLTLGP
jgi:putative membrane protein